MSAGAGDGREAAHGQRSHAVRLDWGPTGATAVGAGADVAVVVDVLSFTTTLTVAVERGLVVHPFAWRDDRAVARAEELGAVLAVGRFEQRTAAPGATVSLSPAAMSQVSPADLGTAHVVLPSPNGSATSAGLRDAGVEVVGACLRNAGAVGRRLAPRVAGGAVVAVVPAGERWYDDSLRPAAEDLWGAGAVVDALVAAGVDVAALSPEAELARDAFVAVRDRLPERLLACAGGQELAVVGFADDVAVAAQLDVSDVVPVLGVDGFRDSAGSGRA